MFSGCNIIQFLYKIFDFKSVKYCKFVNNLKNNKMLLRNICYF